MQPTLLESACGLAHPKFLVINWHLTEACNFHCGFCYAKYADKPQERELIHSKADTARLLKSIADYSSEYCNGDSSLLSTATYATRINLAGGEPLLYPDEFLRTVNQARGCGLAVSCITNGSLLNERVVSDVAPKLKLLGLSIDSLNPATNARIGRVGKHGQLDIPQLIELLTLARRCNPALEIKINTVVNHFNCDEDFSEFIRQVRPEKWKVLQVLPVTSNRFNVPGCDFKKFVDRHHEFSGIMRVEDNDAMTHSYLMIDPFGRFYQNRANRSGYDYSQPIAEVGVRAALAQIDFDGMRYQERY